jgi:CubicO group peptidase (beta-lactamase class C family)
MSTSTFPSSTWDEAHPSTLGMDGEYLRQLGELMQGDGIIVRQGKIVFSWGDQTSRTDVWSACKPVITHFLFNAVQEGIISNLDEMALIYEPRLSQLNAARDHKDCQISLRHLANQVSCYGVQEWPGTAFDYNDWQMALFIDVLFKKIYDVPYESWDENILHCRLTDRLQCEDDPTLFSYGGEYRQGRLGMSVRDFARFGLLYLHGGNWNGQQILREDYARRAVTEPLSNDIPRAGLVAAEMIPGQRSLGSEDIPDNQCEHYGSYSWCWWINGADQRGQRYFFEAPLDTFCALGDTNGRRGLAVIPSRDLVLSWNNTRLDKYPEEPHPLNDCFRLLMQSLGEERPETC